MAVQERLGNDGFVGVFSYAGMPSEEAERSQRLFAAEVLPELRKLGPASCGAPVPAPAPGLDVGLLGS